MLEAGDVIKCLDDEDAIQMMKELAKEGIETEFSYCENGQKGIFLVVVGHLW